MATTEKVIEAIEILEGVFTRWVPNENTIKAWIFALNDLSDEQLTLGLGNFVANSSSDYARAPVPGDIRRYAQAKQTMTWEKAFNEVMSKAHQLASPEFRNGNWMPVKWSSPQIPEVMNAMGGHEYFQTLRSSDMNTARAQFRDAWKNAEERHGGKLLQAPMQTEFPQLPAPEQREVEFVRSDLNENGLTEEQQARADELCEMLMNVYSGESSEKVISMIAKKMAKKDKLGGPKHKGWAEALKEQRRTEQSTGEW